jgi:hypothetical protein
MSPICTKLVAFGTLIIFSVSIPLYPQENIEEEQPTGGIKMESIHAFVGISLATDLSLIRFFGEQEGDGSAGITAGMLLPGGIGFDIELSYGVYLKSPRYSYRTLSQTVRGLPLLTEDYPVSGKLRMTLYRAGMYYGWFYRDSGNRNIWGLTLGTGFRFTRYREFALMDRYTYVDGIYNGTSRVPMRHNFTLPAVYIEFGARRRLIKNIWGQATLSYAYAYSYTKDTSQLLLRWHGPRSGLHLTLSLLYRYF